MPRSGKVLIGPSAVAMTPLIIRVREIVGVKGRLMASDAGCFTKKQSLPTHFGLVALSRIDLAIDAQLRCLREVQ